MELAWHLVLAKEYDLMDRVMWGTDYPCCNPKSFVNWMQKDLNEIAKKCGWPTFSEQEINQMLGGNAAEFLGLET
jgi:predicted TIM-barrel fold metal-dependent hydrolase